MLFCSGEAGRLEQRRQQLIGLQLFRRLTRGLLLSDTGQVLFFELREVFLRLDKALAQVQASDSQGALTISVAPVFAAKWLLPRLQRFGETYPAIDLRMSSTGSVIDFQRDSFDAAVRLGHGRYPGLVAVKLLEESVTPMCSPRILEGGRSMHKADDLHGHVLLHDDSMGFDPAAPDWGGWLQEAGSTAVNASRGPRFGQPDHALQAAIDGAGVVLGWRQMAADDIAAGRLITPFELALPLGSNFYLVYPEAYAGRQKVVMLQDWLLREIGQP